jgi:hypothetical protein
LDAVPSSGTIPLKSQLHPKPFFPTIVSQALEQVETQPEASNARTSPQELGLHEQLAVQSLDVDMACSSGVKHSCAAVGEGVTGVAT